MIALLLAAAAPEPVRCMLDERPLPACRLLDTILPGGDHRLEFRSGTARITFVGRAQSGWWSGTLDGRPAMGFERNRGNVTFATRDLGRRFSWWYPAEEHGSY